MVSLAVWEFPSLIAAVLIAVGVIGKSGHFVYRWMKKFDTSMEYLTSEMSFNGGSTMRDAVKRIEIRLDRIEDNQAVVAAELQNYRRRPDPAVTSMQHDVTELLEHDAERDVPGLRYEPHQED